MLDGIILILVFLFGLGLGLLIPYYVKKYVNELIEKEEKSKDITPNTKKISLTDEILNEWINGENRGDNDE